MHINIVNYLDIKEKFLQTIANGVTSSVYDSFICLYCNIGICIGLHLCFQPMFRQFLKRLKESGLLMNNFSFLSVSGHFSRS